MGKAVSRLPSKDWKVATTGGFSCTTEDIEQRLVKHGVKIQFGISDQPYHRSTHLILGPTTTTTKSFGLDCISGHGSDRHKDAIKFGIHILTEAELLPLLAEADLQLAKKEVASGEKKKEPKNKNKASAIRKNKSPSKKKKSPAKKKKVSKATKVDDASDDGVEDPLTLLLNANDSEDSETFAEPGTESE